MSATSRTVVPPTPHAASPVLHDAPLLRPLAGSLAHNVNNALTGVIGHMELALRHVAAGSAAAEHLHAGLSCAFRAADAVRRIVTFAARRPETAAVAPLSLHELVEEVLAHQTVSTAIKVVVTGSRDGLVLANETLLRSALEELIQNSLEAMSEGGTLTLCVEEANGLGVLKVSDTGSGIASEVREHLFEPFVTTKASGHLGLGLALSRESVEAQGGMISVTSVAGQGTTVTLSFPVAILRVDDRQLGSAAPHLAPLVHSMRQAV